MEETDNMSTLNEASIVDLKAELYKKEVEAKQRGIGNKGHAREHKKSKTLEKIAMMTGKAPKTKVLPPSINTPAKPIEEPLSEYEMKKLRDSEDSLKAKARLYDKLQDDAKKGISHENLIDIGLMVDFKKKNSDFNLDSRHKSDMSREKQIPQKLVDEKFNKPHEKQFFEDVQIAEAEHRMKMNQKWEEERQRLKEKPLGQEHYQDVFFDELREHGVGYYHFSSQESERAAQLDLLKNLRNQTVEARKKNEEIKAKRQKALTERLEKIKKRRGLLTDEKVDESPSNFEADISDERKNKAPSNVEVPISIQINNVINESREEMIVKEWSKKLKYQQNLEGADKEEPIDMDFAPPKDYTIKSKRNRFNH